MFDFVTMLPTQAEFAINALAFMSIVLFGGTTVGALFTYWVDEAHNWALLMEDGFVILEPEDTNMTIKKQEFCLHPDGLVPLPVPLPLKVATIVRVTTTLAKKRIAKSLDDITNLDCPDPVGFWKHEGLLGSV